MMERDSIFIFAGEPSGDLHGSHLLKQLRSRFPASLMWGVGGPEMRNAQLECVLHMEDFAVMGFSDVFRLLPKLWRQFKQIKKHILNRQPKLVVLIDYPGFNLRLAKHLRSGGYQGKIVQYVSPTVWAHGKQRIRAMERTLDLLITIYPFESAYFDGSPLNVQYAGNPIREYVANYSYKAAWRSELSLPATDQLIAVFPGSRQGEIRRNLPFLLNTFTLIREKYPQIIFAISYADEKIKQLINNIIFINSPGLTIGKEIFLIPKQYNYELMRDCRSALAKSGTVALELALHSCPSVIIYRLSFFNWAIAKYILRLNLQHFCIANILSQKETYPEFIKHSFTPQTIAEAIESMHQEGSRRNACIEDCKSIHSILGPAETSFQAAQAIENLIT